MILKLQHVSVFYIKPSSGSKFVPNKFEQATRNPTPSHAQYDMLPTYLKNNYRLKANLLGTNLLPDDGFI